MDIRQHCSLSCHNGFVWFCTVGKVTYRKLLIATKQPSIDGYAPFLLCQHLTLYLNIGPDHMTVYLSPASGVHLLTSSLGSLYPIEDYDGGDRLTYFIYYSHGADVGPWEVSLELVVSQMCD